MAEIHDETGLKSAIFNRLSRGEFRQAWDNIVLMTRKALLKKEGIDSRYENRDHLQHLIHDCIYAKGGDVSARARTVALLRTATQFTYIRMVRSLLDRR